MMLTRDELMKMDGKPVYLQMGSGDFDEGWAICEKIGESVGFYTVCECIEPDIDLYNLEYNDKDGRYGLHILGWRAFKQEPSEGCDACFDGIYITDMSVEHPYCAECGRMLISPQPTITKQESDE